jgi:hypothetical protein
VAGDGQGGAVNYWELEFNLDADRAAFPDDVILGPEPAQPEPPRRTFQERHDAFIADGLCPACKLDLDESGFCSICGFDLAQDSAPMTIELRDDYVPQLPLPIDEFAPAAVDEAA